MAWWKSCSMEEEMASTGADMACSRARLGVSWTDAGVVGGNDDGDDAVEEDLWDLGRAMPPRLRFALTGGQDFVGGALSLELLHGGG
jgi:hypothetical protein